MRWLWLVLTGALLMGPFAYACSCAGRGPCGAFQMGDTVFLGKAISVSEPERRVPGTRAFPRRVYRLEVTEAFSGTPRASEVIEVETGLGGGDCGYRFEIGQSYLVDAGRYGENGRLSTGICSATQPEVMARNLLREIRAILAHQRLPDLSGTVLQEDSLYGRTSLARALPGVTVRLTSESGKTASAVTDDEGTYRIFDLPADTYRIAYELPPDLVNYGDAMGQPQTVTIPVGGRAVCHADARALPSGTISGQIVDGAGKPVGVMGIVSLRRPGATADEQSGTYNGVDGRFTIHFVKAGEYRVVYRLYGHGPARETWLEPGSAYPQGTVIVNDGAQVKDVVLVAR